LTVAVLLQGIIERDISVIRKETEIASLSTELTSTKAELTAARKTIFSLQVTRPIRDTAPFPIVLSRSPPC
jgi:hypothetical protein